MGPKIKHELPIKQMRVKTNQTSFLCRNCSRQHKTELKTWRHAIWQHEKHELRCTGKVSSTRCATLVTNPMTNLTW